ncbi:MAG: hypothetical protein ACXWLB_01720 [Reyranella sp.]
MTWTTLASRLNDLPHVLAGPLLRQVTPKSVTVWVAVRKPGSVSLTVLDASGGQVMSASRHTVAVGTNLHIVAVTARQAQPVLTEGVIYRYDMTFNFDGGPSESLAAATANAKLAYLSVVQPGPTFCLPPQNINQLRLICGSCRIPHGNGKDAFPIADRLIGNAAANPAMRPHQLLLTGDQIYADDVAPIMLLMLSDAAHVLLGWDEILPVASDHGGPATGTQLVPYLRRDILDAAGFTSEDLDGHLMSLGEYVCMYLFVWSDVLWQPDALPTFQDLVNAGHTQITDLAAFGHWLGDRTKNNDSDTTGKHAKRIELFRDTVSQVRRLMANIPSYMILDDHEVTDDWNMTRDFCKGVYGSPLGLRVVQNALVAYALCQHWGNVPEQFDGQAAPPPPGQTLLGLLDGTNATRYAQQSPQMQTLLGVHDAATLEARPDHGAFHDANSLLYDFTVEGPGHQVIFTDTRTWRSFPGTDAGSVLLPPEQLHRQIGGAPDTGNRALIVVLSTNAPAVETIRSATRHDTIANLFEHFPDVYEAWELPSVAFDRLIATLSGRLPLVNGWRTGPLILLSGDVHFGFASRLLYRATTRYEDSQPQPATSVIAQLVASSFRKQTDNTLGFHREGYDYLPHWYLRPLVPRRTPEGYVGWNVPRDSQRAVGQIGDEIGGAWVPLLTLNLDQPTVAVSPDGLFLGVAVDAATPPDYSYRLDYLLPAKDGIPPAQPPAIPPLPTGATPAQRQQAAEAFHLATGQYRRYNSSSPAVSKIVGVNNMGEITFDWSADPKKRKVNLTLRWRSSSDVGDNNSSSEPDPVQFTDYVVSLDPDDADFPEITPRAMP